MKNSIFVNSSLGIGIIIAVSAIFAFLMLSTINASAADISPSPTPSPANLVFPAAGSTSAPMIILIDSSGNILIRGTVVSAGTRSLTISSWGGTWTIRTLSGGMVFSSSQNEFGDMSALRVGDFLGAIGTVASDQMFSVDASIVRNWTTNPLTEATRLMTSPTPSSSGVIMPTPPSSGGGDLIPVPTVSGGGSTGGGSSSY